MAHPRREPGDMTSQPKLFVDQPLVQRAAGLLHLPLWHEAKSLTQRSEIKTHSLWRSPPLDAQGRPLLLIGGLGSTHQMLAPLRDLLRRFNFRCSLAPMRLGVDCGESIAERVERTLERLVDTSGHAAIIIGHSRGGQIGRVLAARRPDLTLGLITLGSPLTCLLGVNPWLLAPLGVLALAGSIGVPGLVRASCGWGTCCDRLRTQLVGPFPPQVPFTSVYSRDDRIVNWRSCLDPAAQHLEVRSTHTALTSSPASLVAVTEELMRMLQPPHHHALNAS